MRFDFGDVWKCKYVAQNTHEGEVHEGSECVKVLRFTQYPLYRWLEKNNGHM
jgi:hypothetical protein